MSSGPLAFVSKIKDFTDAVVGTSKVLCILRKFFENKAANCDLWGAGHEDLQRAVGISPTSTGILTRHIPKE